MKTESLQIKSQAQNGQKTGAVEVGGMVKQKDYRKERQPGMWVAQPPCPVKDERLTPRLRRP